MSQFEKQIKNSLEGYEAPIDGNAWDSFENSLNRKSKSSSGFSFYKQFIVAGVVLTGVALMLNFSASTTDVIADNHTPFNPTENVEGLTTNHTVVAESNNPTAEAISSEDIDLADTNSSEINSTNEVSSSNAESRIDTKKETTNNLTVDQKSSIIRINELIEDKSVPVTEYHGKNFNLNALTSFSPNGDGISDSFLPEGISDQDVFIMEIYDIRDSVVFSTDDINYPWTGKTNTDKIAKSGKYRWKVALLKDGRREIFTGIVKVER